MVFFEVGVGIGWIVIDVVWLGYVGFEVYVYEYVVVVLDCMGVIILGIWGGIVIVFVVVVDVVCFGGV